MLYANSGIRLPNVGEFLDQQESELIQQLGDYTCHEMRQAVEELGGQWDCFFRPHGQYDSFNMPYKGETAKGTIIIERPWRAPNERHVSGHQVSFVGKFAPDDLEESLGRHLAKIPLLVQTLILEREERAKKFFQYL